MFDTYITVIGNVVDDPALRTTASGRPVTSFRVASTSRRRNPETNQFEDAAKFFVSVVCWQDMAHHVARSIHKGQPVVVTGRIATREYTKDEQLRATYEITADAVGPNLAHGFSEFTKVRRGSVSTSVVVGADGMSPDLTDEVLAQLTGARPEVAASNT